MYECALCEEFASLPVLAILNALTKCGSLSQRRVFTTASTSRQDAVLWGKRDIKTDVTDRKIQGSLMANKAQMCLFPNFLFVKLYLTCNILQFFSGLQPFLE